jgi:hypothetical protein
MNIWRLLFLRGEPLSVVPVRPVIQETAMTLRAETSDVLYRNVDPLGPVISRLRMAPAMVRIPPPTVDMMVRIPPPMVDVIG